MPRAAASCGVDAHRLAAPDLRREARRAEIQLAVQAGRRLVGDQLQRKPRRQRRGQRLRPAPSRSGGRGSRDRRSRRSSPRRSRSGRSASATARPQGRGGRRARCRRPTALSAIPARPAPRTRRSSARCGRVRPARGGSARRYARSHCARRAALGETVGKAEKLGQPTKIAWSSRASRVGRHGPMHRDHQRIAGGGADILALQRDRRRQHDIGMTRGRGPRPNSCTTTVSGRAKASRSRPRC